jgi:hypothetical protein
VKHLFFAADRLEQAGLGTSGVDLFVGTMPSDVARGIMLIDPLTGHEIDDGMAGFFNTQFQAIVRDPVLERAYETGLAISQALTLNNVEGDGITISWLRPMTLPVNYPRGDAGDIETSVRFRIGFGQSPA